MKRNEAIFIIGKIEEAFRADHMDTESEALAMGIYALGTVDELRKERDTALSEIQEIVQCKDCKYWGRIGLCEKWDRYISNEDFYCGCMEEKR